MGALMKNKGNNAVEDVSGKTDGVAEGGHPELVADESVEQDRA